MIASKNGMRVTKIIKIRPQENVKILYNKIINTARGNIRIVGMLPKNSIKIQTIKANIPKEIIHSIVSRERAISIGLICLYASKDWFAIIDACIFVTDLVKNRTATIPVTRKTINSSVCQFPRSFRIK
jgi:hypothetical protein